MLQNLKVCWISAGASSFIAGWLERTTIDEFLYIDIEDQDRDSIRFIKDCEKFLGKEIKILKSVEYNNVDVCIRAYGGFRNARKGFYPCTAYLKKRVRKQWEDEHKNYNITYVWGFDAGEIARRDGLIEAMPQFEHEFPLIDNGLTKQDVHGMVKKLGLKRPRMYDMGYNNNNCIGCIKGGKGYWNKIRKDFPEVFNSRAKLEREVGYSIIMDRGNPVFLDELNPDAGWKVREVLEDCGIACEIALDK